MHLVNTVSYNHVLCFVGRNVTVAISMMSWLNHPIFMLINLRLVVILPSLVCKRTPGDHNVL